jgi:hypothetical protein
LELSSRNEAFGALGKLRASVPSHAQGFTIGSPKVDLVDRGTEFGLQVDSNKQTEVQVFQGKVEMYEPGSNRTVIVPRALTTGQGLRLDTTGAGREIISNPAAFLTAQELAARSREEIRACQESWLAASVEIRKDPHLLAYYTFQHQEPWSRTLGDQALDRQQAHDATIVGCSWGQGRWQGKSSLEFKGVTDRVRLTVPGNYDSLTLMAWVRVDALPNGNNSLMMSDGWDEGGVHWQIGDSGKLILGIRSPTGKDNGHYHAFDVFTPDKLKRWTHLATVYDSETGVVTHYVDGKLANRVQIAVDVSLRVGTAEIGNWNDASYRVKQPIRFFSGGMDEFMLFSRPLSALEIDQLYACSRPPS